MKKKKQITTKKENTLYKEIYIIKIFRGLISKLSIKSIKSMTDEVENFLSDSFTLGTIFQSFTYISETITPNVLITCHN